MKPDPNKKHYIHPDTAQMVEAQKALANAMLFRIQKFPN